MLIGLVSKNGILILEFANQRKNAGMTKLEAIKYAAAARFRPILMTSLATILGIMPLALGLGVGAKSRVAMGGCPNQRYPLLFRDYLRTHPTSAAAYAELKRRLAASLADPHAGQEEHLPRVASINYPEVKDPAVDLIYFAAEDWAPATGWEPGPPDA